MKKNYITIIISMIMAFVSQMSSASNTITYTTVDGTILWPYNYDFGANIIDNVYSNGVGTLFFDGEVTTIGYLAFYDCDRLETIKIPNSVSSIGNYAFDNCATLSKVDMPERMYGSIGDYAFNYCPSLTNITIPSSTNRIGAYAFGNCYNLESANIDNGVSEIGSYAFAGCSKLSNISLPNSVRTIGSYAFNGCSSLSNIIVPSNVSSIGECAFSRCNAESIIVDPRNVRYHSNNNCNAIIDSYYNTLIVGCKNTIIPNDIACIGSYAFYDCDGLTDIAIPNSVNSISPYAFSDCDGLTAVTIPNSVTSIGMCSFSWCRNLREISLPNSINSIEESTFYYCYSLTNISIPSSVRYIYSNAFYECYSLSRIDIPYGVWYVYSNAFAYCNSAQSITIPSSVAFIDSGVFNGCCVSTDNFNNYSSLVDDNYWGAKIYDYETGDGLMIKDNKVVSCRQDVRAVNIPEGIIAIEDYAFSYCKSLEYISIPNSVKKIGNSAFWGCVLLNSVVLPNGLEELGSSVFYECHSLESIEICGNVSTINEYAFYNCNNLKKVSITSTLLCIENNAFYGCNNLFDIELPNSLISIKNDVFSGCQSLAEIVIPQSVQTIGTGLFSGCGSLKSIIVDKNNSIYDSRNDCNAIIETKSNTLIAGCQTTLIPSGITSIDSYAFYNCDGLTTIEIPSSIKSIGEYAISYCNSLQSIFVGPDPAYCSSYAFNGIYSSCKLYVPKGYKYSYLYQNEWSKFDNIVEYAQQGDIEYADNLLYMEDCDFYYGAQYTVPVMMKNENENITAFSFELQLPEGLNVAKDEAGNYMISLVEDRKTATHGVSAVQDDNGLLKVAVYSVMNRPLVGTEGAVLNITFDLDETLAVGKHPLSLQEVVMTCTSGYKLATLSYKASVTLHDHSLGDVNHDGSVSITDAIGIINLYLNTDTEGLYVEAADINRDGKVNITDAVWVIDMILNDTGSLAPKRAAKREEGTLTMQFDDICIGQERYVELPVFLRSSSDDITAMQAVLNLPTGVHLDDVIGSGNHQVAWNAQPDGSVRLLSLSLKNECFDSESAVVVLQLRCDASFSSGYVNMNDIELATRSLNGIEMSALSAAISREPNVIEQVRKDADCASDLYDLQGRRAQGSHKGDVMIENGKVKIMK